MKKKIVVKIISMNDYKLRSEALKISSCISGVDSVALTGADKDQVVVVGEDMDAVKLTRQLRKKLGFAELVSVGEDKKETPAAKVEAPAPQPIVICSHPPQYVGYTVYEHEQFCTIM